MSRAPYKHPTVFVGCPYTPVESYAQFREALDMVPLWFIFANDLIRTQYLLERVRSGISHTDYSLFDITDWNANVTLEVGLAEGMNRRYYISFGPGRGAKMEPPADLQGLQRIQYKRYDGFTPDALTYQLNEHLVKRLTHPRYIFARLSARNRMKKFLVAMRILAYFKRNAVLWERRDLRPLIQGSHLRRAAVSEVLQILNGNTSEF